MAGSDAPCPHRGDVFLSGSTRKILVSRLQGGRKCLYASWHTYHYVRQYTERPGIPTYTVLMLLMFPHRVLPL